MAAHTMSLMIVLSMQDRDHSRLSPNAARCNSFPFAARQLQAARIRTLQRAIRDRLHQKPWRQIDSRAPRGPLHHSRHVVSRVQGALRRNGALAAPEPQNGPLSTKHHEQPSSYIRLTGRSDAWRDPRGLSSSRCSGWHWHFGGARRRIAVQRSSTSIIAANNANCNEITAAIRPT